MLLTLIAYCGSFDLQIPYFQIGDVTTTIYKHNGETLGAKHLMYILVYYILQILKIELNIWITF